MEDENRKNIDNTIYRTQEEVNKALGALYIDDKDLPDYSQYEGITYNLIILSSWTERTS